MTGSCEHKASGCEEMNTLTGRTKSGEIENFHGCQVVTL